MPRTLRLATVALFVGAAGLFFACSATPPSAPGARPGGAASLAPTDPTAATRQISCGATTCAAGAEICCEGERPRCVPLPPPPARPVGHAGDLTDLEADHRWQACGRVDYRVCDDAGDCKSDETCCQQQLHVGDGAMLSYAACRPLVRGRVRCEYEELCSKDDGRCLRKGNVCSGDPPTRCALPRPSRASPACLGGKPCAVGTTCVETATGRACAPAGSLPAEAELVECNGGADCGEDESCFVEKRKRGSRCAYQISGIDPTAEYAICRDVADCEAHCRLYPDLGSRCRIDPATQKSACECPTRCTKDDDCGPGGLCSFMASVQLESEAGFGEAFCNRSSGLCDCRPGPR